MLNRQRIGSALLCSGVMLLGSMQAESAAPKRDHVLVRHGNVTIDTTVDGEGPAIVLLPSLGRDSDDYDAVAEGLAAKGFRVLRPRPRGFGRSVGPTTGISLHDFARDVAEVIAHSGGGRAIVVGHAYGNWVARTTAVDFPERVRGVVIAAAAAKQYDPVLTTEINKASDATLPRDVRLAALRFAFFAPGNDPSVWLSGWSPELRTVQRAAAAAVKQSDWWSGGTAPLLDLQAELDPFKTPDKRNEMKDEFGDRVTVTVIANASHALIPEQPRAVVEAIAAWALMIPK
jgi:pimeloyl-ACP methyl ester carboxylesterase